MNTKMETGSAVEEALCSLYQYAAKNRDNLPTDIINAMSALELFAFQDAALEQRMLAFSKHLDVSDLTLTQMNKFFRS